MTNVRVGIGYDIHRLVKGRDLWLGGINIASDVGLQGHSDADVLLHAVTDAVLGAAALPDIGHYFPPGDDSIKDIASSQMLFKALSEAGRLGYEVANVDAVLVAEKPKIASYREAIRKSMARLLRVRLSDVQVKGKTNEGLDAIGEGKAMAAHAVVLLRGK